jgi:Uma2 family endonuclease
MTPEEFDAITNYDERYRYELVHGVLVVNPIPSEAEAEPNEELGYWLRDYRDHHPQGSILDLTLSERYLWTGDSRHRADRLIWAGLRRLPDTAVDVPTIAVEFVSRGKRDWLRDYQEKHREYLALGVVEYWIIDHFRCTMTVYRNPPRAPAEQVFSEMDVYRTDLLLGFELPLARLMAVADKWPKRSKWPK